MQVGTKGRGEKKRGRDTEGDTPIAERAKE